MDGIETYREGPHTVRIVTDRHKFAKFRRRWNKALDEYPLASMYLRHEWLQSLWDVYQNDINGCVMMIDDKDGPCALVPFMAETYRYRGLTIPALAPIPAARTDIPLIRDQVECMRLIGQYSRKRGAQVWHLHDVPERSPALTLLQSEWDVARTIEQYNPLRVPVVDTSTSWPQFLQARSPYFQDQVAQIHEGTASLGMTSVAEPAALIATLNRIRKRSAAPSQASSSFLGAAFTERVIREAAAAQTLRSVVAYDETLFARPAVGATVGISYNGTIHVLDTVGHAHYPSAGIGTFAEMLWQAFDNDHIKRFDVSELDDSAAEARSWATDHTSLLSTMVLNGGVGSTALRAGRALGGLARSLTLPKRNGGDEAAA